MFKVWVQLPVQYVQFHKNCIWSESSENSWMDINTAAVAGRLITNGSGFVALERCLGGMDVRCMSSRHNDIVSKGWEESAVNEMKEAAEEEIRLTKERGDVNKDDGIPWLTVVADGSWEKRSFRRYFNSLSGMVSCM